MEGTQNTVAAGSIPANTTVIAVANGMSVTTIMTTTAMKSGIIMRAITGNIDFTVASLHATSDLRKWKRICASCRRKLRRSKNT